MLRRVRKRGRAGSGRLVSRFSSAPIFCSLPQNQLFRNSAPSNSRVFDHTVFILAVEKTLAISS